MGAGVSALPRATGIDGAAAAAAAFFAGRKKSDGEICFTVPPVVGCALRFFSGGAGAWSFGSGASQISHVAFVCRCMSVQRGHARSAGADDIAESTPRSSYRVEIVKDTSHSHTDRTVNVKGRRKRATRGTCRPEVAVETRTALNARTPKQKPSRRRPVVSGMVCSLGTALMRTRSGRTALRPIGGRQKRAPMCSKNSVHAMQVRKQGSDTFEYYSIQKLLMSL